MPWSGIGQPGIGDPFLGAYAAGPPDRATGPYGWSNPLASFLDLMDQINLQTGNNDPRMAAILTGVGNYGSGSTGARGGQGYTNPGFGNPFAQGQGPFGLPGYMMPPWQSLIPGLSGIPVNLPPQYPTTGPAPGLPTGTQAPPSLGPGLPTPTDPFGGTGGSQQQINDLLEQIKKNFTRLPTTPPPQIPPPTQPPRPNPNPGGPPVLGPGNPPTTDPFQPKFPPDPRPGPFPTVPPNPPSRTAPPVPSTGPVIRRIAPTKSRVRTG